jgi:hypothetical protein
MRINADPVDALITAAIFRAFNSTAVRERLAAPTESNDKIASLRASLIQDEDRLQRVDDDHYDGVLDRQAWLRQRARLEDRLNATRRELDQLSARAVIDTADLDIVRGTWEERTPDWQHAVARLIFDKVLIHPHPPGIATRLTPFKVEDPNQYQLRADRHRRELLKIRVQFIRRV